MPEPDRKVENGYAAWRPFGTGVTTTRSVFSFSQLQLQSGASRLYLGVHLGCDNLQGQLLGVSVADAILLTGSDPAPRRRCCTCCRPC